MAKAPRTKKETPGPELEPHQVILQPLVTEKGTHQFTRHNAYPFQVNQWANKQQIKAAVEELFNVRVEQVRIVIEGGKDQHRDFGRMTYASLRSGRCVWSTSMIRKTSRRYCRTNF